MIVHSLLKITVPKHEKIDDVPIIYTPWTNLKKERGAEPGQVSFVDMKLVKKVKVKTRIASVLKRLNKTKIEKTTIDELKQMKEDRLRQLRNEEKKRKEEERKKEQERKTLNQQNKEMLHYTSVMKDEYMVTNQDLSDTSYVDYEDNFM